MHNIRRALLFLASLFTLAGSANAATVTYTLAGGGITGSLGGSAFTATSFSITATGDSSTIQSGLFEGFPIDLSALTAPVMLINTTTGPLTTTLIPSAPGYLWQAYSLYFGGGVSTVGFGEFVGFTNPGYAIGIVPAAGPLSLTTPAIYSGALDGPYEAATSDGLLSFTASATPATFAISVPEPSSAMASLLLSLAGLSLVSRRKRKA